MIRTSQLHGRGVVDVDSATKLGEIDELFFDLERRRLAGISVNRGGTLLSGEERLILPAAAIQSIGDDAIMVRSGMLADGIELNTRGSSLAGRAIVTESGTHLGAIDDVIFEPESGHVLGYAFAERDDSRGPDLAGLFGMGGRAEGHDDGIVDYIRADADLRFGDLLVVPESAVVRNEKLSATHTSPTVTVTRVPPATA
ncbi:MAG TPA: PRC-barrel domain-containing protein [Chloroflexota bacterium]|nr:PRC-barrel domain-containing protein [Chloroflexota bacterium]